MAKPPAPITQTTTTTAKNLRNTVMLAHLLDFSADLGKTVSEK
jgi:hypothetical protein